MSLIQEYRETESAIRELQSRLEILKSDQSFKVEMEFEQKLRELMGEYQKSLRDVISIIDPQMARSPQAKGEPKVATSRRERKVKQYKNPFSGEMIETKGGNNKILKQWKAEHGAEEVESWANLLG
jgi:hypothetical protein